MPTELIPFHDNILMEAIEGKTKTASGIIIPDRHVDHPPQGKVIDRGPNVSPNIELGDILFYPHSAQTSIGFKGRTFLMVSESQVMGAIRETKEKEKTND